MAENESNRNSGRGGGAGGGGQSRGKSGSEQQSGSGGAASAVQSVTDAGRAAVDKFEQYSNQATETYEHSREQINQWLDDVRERATNEPLKTVLMATGVGIVLGVLFG
jgi:ElaB/YqjD/DUF883 family membrane-anchored ribosome-binding protein